jgi:hypothetical protein
MAYHQGSQRAAKPEKDESIFVLGMLGVGDQKRVLVEKHGLRLLERNAVLAPVLRVLFVDPLEVKHGHPTPIYLQCNGNSTRTRRMQQGSASLKERCRVKVFFLLFFLSFSLSRSALRRSKRLRKLLAHRYSVVCFGLVLCELVVAFGLMSRGYLGGALTPDSQSVRHLAVLSWLVGLTAIISAGLGLAKEEFKGPAITAAALSGLSFFVCLLRFAV